MSDNIKVIIKSGDPEANKGETVMFNASGQAIGRYDTEMWLTEDEIEQLEDNGFTVEEVN